MKTESFLDALVGFKRLPSVRHAVLLLPRWVTPNAVTLLGGVLTLPALWELLRGNVLAAAAWFLAASAMDVIDGAIALARGEESVFGKYLDPLIDKCRSWSVVIAACIQMPGNLGLLFALPTIVGVTYAILQTLERTRKLAAARVLRTHEQPPEPDRHDITANSWGKKKALWETLAIVFLLAALGTEWRTLYALGFVALCASLPYAHWSYVGQRRTDQPAA